MLDMNSKNAWFEFRLLKPEFILDFVEGEEGS
jgi:hypothetical protein